MAWMLATLVVFTRAAFADEPSAADISAARDLGREGIKLADAGKCAEAIDRFSRAEKLYHAPTILARLGECQVKIGKIVQGSENLQKVVHEPLPDKAPPQFVKARERAQKILKEVEGKIGRLKIIVNAPPKTEVTIKIDGEPVSAALIGADRPTDPGEHFVEAVAPGYLKSSETVVIKEGGSETVTLDMKIDPEAPPPPPPPDEHKVLAAPAPPPPSSSGLKTAGFVVLGVGAAGIVVGSIFGFVTLSQKSDLDKLCPGPDHTCPPGQQGKIDSANAMGWVSTIGFIAGGVGVAAGLTMILLGSASKAERPKTTFIRPVIGPATFGLHGAF
jgi:hypothetical protein